MMRALQALILLLLAIARAEAHKPSDSYLMIELDGAAVSGQWDIALRDLDYALSLDENDDGAIDWGEVRRRFPEWSDYVLGHLQLADDAGICPMATDQLLIDEHTDGRYAVMRFSGRCGGRAAELTIRYRLFFDLDPQHRGLLRVERDGAVRSAVFAPDSDTVTLGSVRSGPHWAALSDYFHEGVWHIWIGYDHVLFLLSLLLPAALTRDGKGWRTSLTIREILLDVAKIVTAFTLAHSITLSLATLGYLKFPSRWVESSIALSVLLAAGNNLYPLWHRWRARVAFGFGLVHGLGFASVLADLSLPPQLLGTALLGFNLGVECGQLLIVALLLPVALYLSRSPLYVPVALHAGSLTIAMIATVWLIERTTDTPIRIF